MLDKIKDIDFDVIVGLEARGFIFGMPLAYLLGKSFVLVRKKVNYLVRQFQKAMI